VTFYMPCIPHETCQWLTQADISQVLQRCASERKGRRGLASLFDGRVLAYWIRSTSPET